jgi:hypothetical protein
MKSTDTGHAMYAYIRKKTTKFTLFAIGFGKRQGYPGDFDLAVEIKVS